MSNAKRIIIYSFFIPWQILSATLFLNNNITLISSNINTIILKTSDNYFVESYIPSFSLDNTIYVKQVIFKKQKITDKNKLNEFDNGSKIIISSLDSQKVSNLNLLCKLWGFIKYYHPNITLKNYNWDYELFKIIPKVLESNSRNDLNGLFCVWINNLGSFKEGRKKSSIDSLKIKMFPDTKWLSNNQELDSRLISVLNRIKYAYRDGLNSYVRFYPAGNPDFSSEKSYEQFSFPDVGYRLLSLFRYWNIIQYFYPYRYLIEDWQNVLTEFIPKFICAKNELEYKITIQELIAKINDTHAHIWNDATFWHYLGPNISALEVKWIENKFVVSDYLNDDLGKKTSINKGNIIKKINGKNIDDIVKSWLPIFPSSNYSTQLHLIANNLMRSNRNKNEVEYEKDGSVYIDTIDFYNPKLVNIYKKYQNRDTCWKFLTKDIGYINIGTIKKSYIPWIFSELKNTQGIVIDLRYYPTDNTVYLLCDYLLSKKVDFVKFTKGNLNQPGLFTYLHTLQIGKENPEYYKGKIVIIVNENTISAGEFTAMALKVVPGATIIGSTTAAADGNVSILYLPGAIKTQITGIGVYYPDGKETQRIGIVPDIIIHSTIQGIKEGRDEYIEKAIEVIKNETK